MAAPRYLPRSWWADSDWARGGAQLVDDDLHRLGNVCHYPGRASSFGIMSLSNLRSNIRGWWDFHVNGRGWSDIGYQMCVSMTVEGPVVVDLRGIGRVPAAHASGSNPRANWHGGATLWTIGNTERPHPDLVDAYRHFRQEVWLPRWPTATGVTHHRRVPGASTSCAGDHMDALVTSGALRQPPTEDEMNAAQEAKLDALISAEANRYSDLANRQIGIRDTLGTFKTDEASRYSDLAERQKAILGSVVALPDAIVARLGGTADAATIRAIVREELGNLELSLNATPNP